MIDYRICAAAGILRSASAAAIKSDELLSSVKSGDLMTCITLNEGSVLTIPCAYLRIISPSAMRGLFDVMRDGELTTSVMLVVRAERIESIDYFNA